MCAAVGADTSHGRQGEDHCQEADTIYEEERAGTERFEQDTGQSRANQSGAGIGGGVQRESIEQIAGLNKIGNESLTSGIIEGQQCSADKGGQQNMPNLHLAEPGEYCKARSPSPTAWIA